MFVGLASDRIQRTSTKWNRWDGVGGVVVNLDFLASLHAREYFQVPYKQRHLQPSVSRNDICSQYSRTPGLRIMFLHVTLCPPILLRLMV